jgi:hypothetical protein
MEQSNWDWKKVQNLIDSPQVSSNLPITYSIKVSDIYCLIVPDESKRTREDYRSFQDGLSKAIKEGKITGFKVQKG